MVPADHHGPIGCAEARASAFIAATDRDEGKRCGADIAKLFEDFTGEPIPASLTGAAATAGSGKGLVPQVSFVVIRRGGAWYVSPLRTSIDGMTEAMKAVTDDDMTRVRAIAKDLQDGSLDDPDAVAALGPRGPILSGFVTAMFGTQPFTKLEAD